MTVHFPAFCPNCGLIFQSRLTAIGGDAAALTITLSGNRETCPRCGKWAETADGTFDVIGDTIRVLSASRLTHARLRLLAQIMESARAGNLNADETAALVVRAAPELAPLVDPLRRRMGKAGMYFLTAVVSALIAHGVDSVVGGPASASDVQHAVEHAVKYCETHAP